MADLDLPSTVVAFLLGIPVGAFAVYLGIRARR
jgi:hypothetical protein